MSILNFLIYHFFELIYAYQDKTTKQLIISKIISDMETIPRQNYLDDCFNYYTKQHVLSSTLMYLITVTVPKLNNFELQAAIDIIVKDFSYFPDSNTYCVPMVKMNLRSSSILMQPDMFAEKVANVAMHVIALERKLTQCLKKIDQLTESSQIETQ
jgi:hypothetical protein